MEKNIEELVNTLKQQAELFLLDAGEFYPFGTCLDKFDRIIPVGAYLEGEHPLSADLIDLLEKDFRQGVNNGNYQVAAIAIDIIIRKNNSNYNGIELRLFETGKEVYKKYFKYIINEGYVEFVDYPPG